ncbi:MAG: UDP-N-acetylglucosamine transferase subunit ALG13 [Planctomycetota bacterium]|jgi:UDP-N-acetylglucosamine transferase subunit ALG13
MKVFLTVGSQLPFDRLAAAVDAWAQAAGKSHVVTGQIGDTTTPPRHFEWSAELEPQAFRVAVESADIIVGHAGTGTIMAALCAGKSVVVLARRKALQETRNDHQVATVERFSDLPGFHGTADADEIPSLIEAALVGLESPPAGNKIGTPAGAPVRSSLRLHAQGPIVERLRSFLDEALS